MGWFVVHLFICGINSAMLTLNGLTPDTWQWWEGGCVLLCGFCCLRVCTIENMAIRSLRISGPDSVERFNLGLIFLF